MTKILFDIDGVLNPYLMAGLPEGYLMVSEGWISWRLDLINHAAWMRHLEQLAEIVWVSSWEEDSNLVCFYYGTRTTYEAIPLSRVDTGTWKLSSVQDYLQNSDEAIIWIDDELGRDAHAWAANRPNTLLIDADPARGWTRQQYEQMLDFLSNHPA